MKRVICDLCGHDITQGTISLLAPANMNTTSNLDLDWDICVLCATTKLIPFLEKNRHKGDPPRKSPMKTLHG